MVAAPAAPPFGSVDVFAEIDGHILNAVNELIRRAYSGGSAEPSIVDRKEGFQQMRQGLVQDCEFGLAVLIALDWLGKRNRLDSEHLNREAVKNLITSLVLRTVKRTTVSSALNLGGELAGSFVFFTGEPYTFYKIPNKPGKHAFSANLDAAMLIVAFLAAALEEFDSDLSLVSLTGLDDLMRSGLLTLRDAALFVCKEGLLYASRCRVFEEGRFVGYTCEPNSNVPGSPPGTLSDFDRLFFTWTTCETIHELSNWTAYLELLEGKTGSTQALAAETRILLVDLTNDLKKASAWCRETFLDRFRSLEPPPINRVVAEFAKLGQNEAPSPELDRERDRVAEYVIHVYHVSQYAAIRSIEPLEITIEEVLETATLLDTIVSQHVLSSGLDSALNPSLFRTLSRYYSLGQSNEELYRDDAYFPLVVRSLSGLLARTIVTLGTIASREKVLGLVLEFRRSLRARYENLIARRPDPADPGDEYLWSFAPGNPYVLYATQRTLFSLIEYAKFLQTMEKFEKEVPETVQIEREMRDLLARSLADLLIGPVVEKFVNSLSYLKQSPSPDSQDTKNPRQQLPLPDPEWAQPAIIAWLTEFKQEFDAEEHQIYDILRQRANSLIEFGRKLHEARTRSPKSRVTKAMEAAMRDLLAVPEFRSLNAKDTWQESMLIPLLFDHLFRQSVNSDKPLMSLIQLPGAPLWGTIENASQLIDMFNNALEANNTDKG